MAGRVERLGPFFVRAPRVAKAWIGISGYDYPRWRGVFYPEELPRKRWLEFAAERFNSIELNGTFYSLKNPAVFRRWAGEVPKRDFVFAIKGSRFITHNLKLRNAEAALGNFFASGILALGKLTGPFLWQLPDSYKFDAERLDTFMRALPRTSKAAESVAERHDERLRRGALTESVVSVRYRHAFEVRHPSYFCEEFYALLRRHRCAFVIADSAGRWEMGHAVTANFVYARLHGSTKLYTSRYSDEELDAWAARIVQWLRERRDVYVYFDNDAEVHAPRDALRLRERLHSAL
jgi:uncharacterized protein YecE (DUF72 family)